MSENALEIPAETSKVEEHPSPPRIKLTLDELTKAIAFIVGFLYVTGILTTNTYLYSLGISDFSLLEARYITTGFITLFPIIFSILLPSFGLHYFWYRPNVEVSELKSPGVFAFTHLMNSRLVNWEVFLLGWLAPFIMFFIFSVRGGGNIFYSVWQALWMYFLCLSVGMFGIMAITAFLTEAPRDRLVEIVLPWLWSSKTKPRKEPKTKPQNEPPIAITVFVLALFAVGYFAFYLSIFSNHILIKIPEQFGGAQPHQAELLFHTDAVPGARELGIEIAEKRNMSEELTVLFEGENIIVIRLSDDHIIQLSKEMVQAINLSVSEE